MCLSVFTLRDPPVFTLGVLYVLGCSFSSYFGFGSLSLIFLRPFDFSWEGFVRVNGLLMSGLKRGENLVVLSVLLLFTLAAVFVSHRFISFFSEKTFTGCCKASHLTSPTSSIDVAFLGLNIYIYWCLPLWWHLFLTWRSFFLLWENSTVPADHSDVIFGM